MLRILSPSQPNEADVEASFPPEGQFIPVRDWNMHCLTRGNGDDLVLLHGLGGSTRDMSFRFMPALEPHFRVTAIDRPAHGWTDGTDPASVVDPMEQAHLIWETLDAMGISRPLVVGQSYGGAVSLAMALARPGAARGYGLISAASTDTVPLSWLHGSRLWLPLLSPMMAPMAALATDGMVQALVSHIFAPEPVPEHFLRDFGPRMTLRSKHRDHLIAQVSRLNPTLRSMMPSYRRIGEPVSIIHGTADRVLSFSENAGYLANVLPRMRLVPLEGAGHMPHQTRTQDVVQAILRLAKDAKNGCT